MQRHGNYVLIWDNIKGFVTEGIEKISDGIFISIRFQKIVLLRNDRIILEKDCVSGWKNVWDTRTGHFAVEKLDTNTTLTDNKTYTVEVKFWIQFSGALGIHDASWRNKFGGTEYEQNGSHGCINVEEDTAETIYNNSYIGLDVYVSK